MSYVQNVIVSNSNVYMPEIYLVTNSDYLLGYADGDENNNIHTADEIRGKATQITQNLGNATSITGVMSYFNVSTTDDGLGLNISPVLGNTEGAALVLVYDCGETDYYVIIEVVPNAIVGLSIEPAADTPPRATTTDESGETIYIYAAGNGDRPETVRLEADVEYRFSYNRFIVDVEFSMAADSNSEELSINAEVQPNGTVVLNSGVTGSWLIVNCVPIASDGTSFDPVTLTIEISNSITVVAGDMSGTSYAPVSDNDAVAGYPFSFTLDPNPGYGLNPSLLQFDFDGGNIDGHSWHVEMPEERTDNNAGKAYFVGGNTNADQIEYVIYNNNNHTISYEEVSRTASVPGRCACAYLFIQCLDGRIYNYFACRIVQNKRTFASHHKRLVPKGLFHNVRPRRMGRRRQR